MDWVIAAAFFAVPAAILGGFKLQGVLAGRRHARLAVRSKARR